MHCACAIFSSGACPALQYFSHYLTKGMIFEKTVTELTVKRVLMFSKRFFLKHFYILRRNERDVIKNVQGVSNMTGTYAACLHRNQSRSYLNHPVYRSSCEVPLFLQDSNEI